MKRLNKKKIRSANQIYTGPYRRPVCWSDYNDSYCVCHKCWSCKRKMKYTNKGVSFQRTRLVKKAIVTLDAGDTIDLYENI